MSVIHGLRPVASGLDMATGAIRYAQARFAAASADIARSGAGLRGAPGEAQLRDSKPLAQPPPNPGPPGGADPADLAEAMIDQNLATHTVAANVKTLQAFDAMLEELTRIKPGKR